MVMKSTILWYFVLSTLVVVTTVFSKHISGLEESHADHELGERSRLSSPWKRALSPSFFAGNRRPELEGLPGISGGTEIQQKLPNDPDDTTYFFSLFDPNTNTPFYSAYKVTPDQAARLGTYNRADIKENWRYDPKVVGKGVNLQQAYKDTTDKNQGIVRGHMNPSAINSFDKNFMKATFTLTNVVPQFSASNSGPWQEFEAKIKEYAKDICGPRGGTLYLLTGRSDNGIISDSDNPGKVVQDSKNKVPKPIVNTILGIPRSVWTAGCCLWTESGKLTGSYWPARKAQSFAVMSNNHNGKDKLYQTQMSVRELEELLRPDPYSAAVNLFPGDENCRNPANNIKRLTYISVSLRK